MKITIITVGKIKEKYLKDAIAEYSKRLSKYCKLEIVEVADEKTPDNASEVVENAQGEEQEAKEPEVIEAEVELTEVEAVESETTEVEAYPDDMVIRFTMDDLINSYDLEA